MRSDFGSSVMRTKSIDVLLVDRDGDRRDRLQQALEENGCIARAVADADAALREVERRRPEVVVIEASAVDAAGLARTLGEGPSELGPVAVVALGLDAPTLAFDACASEPLDLGVIVDVVRRLGADMRAARVAAREAAG